MNRSRKFQIFFIKLLTLQEVVLRCVHAKQIPKLSEAVDSQMVASIGRLSKSSKMGKWNIPEKYSVKPLTNWNIPVTMRIS